uniref:Uncharacterized protein n=1 Tax=Glossina austeni TaxID=7395 RepID=A0A1A9VNG9_GLOAU
MGTKTQPLAYKVHCALDRRPSGKINSALFHRLDILNNPLKISFLSDFETIQEDSKDIILIEGLENQYMNRRPENYTYGYENYERIRVFVGSKIRCVSAAIAREENKTLNDYYNA